MTAPAAQRPDLAPQGHPQRWLILGVICLAQLTVLLDNTVLNVAIPSLTTELDASTADVQWMINAYSLVQSGLLLTAEQLRRPLRAQEDAGRGPRPVRHRFAGGRARPVLRPAHRGPRRRWGSGARC